MNSKIKNIISPIEPEIDVFEKNLKNITQSCNNFLKDDLENFIFSNQKRLRPIFIFLASKILFENTNENQNANIIQNIALATEILHSASLIHDDIIDEEKTRRNHPSFWAKYGSKTAVLEGDILLSSALEILAQTNLEILKIFAKKINLTIQGELEQNLNLYNAVDFKNYISKTENKTANLFLAGLEALFTLDINKNTTIENYEQTKENLRNFFNNYAIAFQIKNDIENIKKDKSDIKNGNYTLVVLYYLKDNNIKNIENYQNREDFSPYIKKAFDKMKEYKEISLEYLEKIKTSQYKKAFQQLVELTLGE